MLSSARRGSTWLLSDDVEQEYPRQHGRGLYSRKTRCCLIGSAAGRSAAFSRLHCGIAQRWRYVHRSMQPLACLARQKPGDVDFVRGQKLAKLASRFWSPYDSSSNRVLMHLRYEPSVLKIAKKSSPTQPKQAWRGWLFEVLSRRIAAQGAIQACGKRSRRTQRSAVRPKN